MAAEVALQSALRDAIRIGLIRSAHDCSEGGIAVALAESSISGPELVGAEVALPDDGRRDDESLFHEAPGRILISSGREHRAALEEHFANRGVAARRVGTTGGSNLAIRVRAADYRWPLRRLHSAWDKSLGDLMDTVAEPLAAH